MTLQPARCSAHFGCAAAAAAADGPSDDCRQQLARTRFENGPKKAQFTLSTPQKSYVLTAKTEEIAAHWTAKLRRAIEAANAHQQQVRRRRRRRRRRGGKSGDGFCARLLNRCCWMR